MLIELIELKAQELLDQIKKIDAVILNKQNEVERWKDRAVNITAPVGTEKIQASGSLQKMADAVCEYVNLEEEDIRQLFQQRRYIISIIEQLSVTEYELLYNIYVLQLDFDDAAEAASRSRSWVNSAHGRALQNVQRILDRQKVNETVQNC
jgi:DNA-directed RNA polymerase specialized sigma24 family protein